MSVFLKNRRCLTAAAFTALALNGLTYTFVGTGLPSLQAHLGISLDRVGALTALFQAGVTLFTLAGGFLSDLFRRERILMCGCLLLSAGVFFWALYPRIPPTSFSSASWGPAWD